MGNIFTMMRIYKDTQRKFSRIVKSNRGLTIIGETEKALKSHIKLLEKNANFKK